MARRTSKPSELPDALREAVERTVEATLGSAGRSREAAQGALDDLAGSVEDMRRGAGERIARSRRSVTEAIEGRRLATQDDLREVKAELRAIGRRLDAIEERLPAKRGAGTGKAAGGRTAGTGGRKSSRGKRPGAASS
jgi:polyhydroxyalkanoate synthesis regulator phasin